MSRSWSFNSGCRYCCWCQYSVPPRSLQAQQQHQRISVRWTRPHPTPRHPRTPNHLRRFRPSRRTTRRWHHLRTRHRRPRRCPNRCFISHREPCRSQPIRTWTPHRVPMRFRQTPRISTQLHARRQQRQRVHRPASATTATSVSTPTPKPTSLSTSTATTSAAAEPATGQAASHRGTARKA